MYVDSSSILKVVEEIIANKFNYLFDETQI